jgi:transposase
MKQWTDIRTRVLNEGVSKRRILQETGMHWKTLEKILAHGQPPGYRQKASRSRPKVGPFLNRIEDILRADNSLPKKQRHTAQRIFERIRQEGYEGQYGAVKEAVRELRTRLQDVFFPLYHPPGEAQVDFGYALATIGGVMKKVAFFVMALPYSDALFVKAYERECTETFWDGHVQAFKFFGGVPRRITYDNSRVMIAQILGAHKRKLTEGFLQLQSHYLFKEHFCCVRRANEKGVVEALVKYARNNFFVPVPQANSMHELNNHLYDCCRNDLQRRLRGRSASKEERLNEDREAFLELPPAFDACRKETTRPNRYSLVRFRTNDYSVPNCYAHHPVTVKGYVDEICIYHEDALIAQHQRIWEREQVSLKPEHYLGLLEKRPGALDAALPFVDWELPNCFELLRKRMETRWGRGKGTKEYIEVLRLMETRSLPKLTRAIQRALEVQGCTREVVAQYLFSDDPAFIPRFCLDGHPHLQTVQIQSADISLYASLLEGGAL